MGTRPACTRCGEPVGPTDHFCVRCGGDVSGGQGNVATEVTEPGRGTGPEGALINVLRQATLGDYEVLAELGRGGMATVFLAHDIALDRQVAIKVMSPALLAGEGLIERFKREARTAASLSHPNIIPIYAVNESGQLLYFVMKFIEGRPLDSIIKEVGPLPIPMVQAIAHQVGAALGYAHKRGVVHRDVKPANIVVDSEGWAVVTDFGIAKVAEAHGLTMSGVTVGTPSYMSPEQCEAKELTGASDQYSLGVVAYEMLAGRIPFGADSVMAIMYAHFNEPPPPIAKLRPDVPAQLDAAVMRMLEKEPAQRWPSMEAAVAAVGGAPLAHDDPIRAQLVTLAAAGASAQLSKRVSAPVSPTPAGRSRVGRTTDIVALTIAPAQVAIAVGGAVQLTATAKRASGSAQPGRGITWASTHPEVATVTPTGLALAGNPGVATITATQEDTSATATITVTRAEARRGRRWLALTAVAVLGVVAAVWWLRPWATTEHANPGGSRPVAVERTVSPPGTAQLAEPPAPPGPESGSPAQAAPPPAKQTVGRGAPKRAPAHEEPRPAARSPVTAAAAVPPPDTTPAPAPAQVTPLSPVAAPAQPAPTPPAAAPPVRVGIDPRPEIVDVIASYVRALEARDLAAVKRIAPGLGPKALNDLQDFFQAVRNLRVTLEVRYLDVSGDTAVARVTGTFAYIQNGQNVTQPVSFRAALEHGAEGWHIAALQ